MVNVKVFLEGPFSSNSGVGSMSTALNSAGAIPLIPQKQPYDTSPWNYSGPEFVQIGFFAAHPTIVDWVLIELRTGTAANTKVATRAAFVKSDGTIVDTDGSSQVQFAAVASGNYYLVIRHRNHLAVMSASAVALGSSSSLYDFTTAVTQAYGPEPAMKSLGGGVLVFGMFAGDITPNGGIGAGDLISIIETLGRLHVYDINDINMNGAVSPSDLVLDLSNIGQMTQVP